MVKALAEALKPHVWVNVHSGMEALFLPYDHKAEVPPPRDAWTHTCLTQVHMGVLLCQNSRSSRLSSATRAPAASSCIL